MRRKTLLFAAATLLTAPLIAERPAAAAEPLVFVGRVEAAERAVISTRIDGVVLEILFQGGERVAAGDPLIRLDPADAELALAAAEARLDEAEAVLEDARRRAERQEQLAARGVAAEAQVSPARTARASAEARVELAQAERDRAALDLQHTVILAPIAGFISRPALAVGAFLEAESGPPLARIVSLDPVLVAYEAPYADRLASLEATRAATVDELLEGVRITLRLPGGRIYGAEATPHAASADVDPVSGTVTVWARFPNPQSLLRPGMIVDVLSQIGAGEIAE
ncbi:MAG: efflux RND transporter periplasmic adaptor subunit [Pseudomonadota bacterium]